MFAIMGIGMQTQLSCCGAFTVAVGIIGLVTTQDGQQDSGSGESGDQNAEGDGSLTPEISEKSDQQDNKKKEDVSRSGKSPNTEDTVVQCLIWGAVLVTAGGTGTVLALRRRPRRSRSRRR